MLRAGKIAGSYNAAVGLLTAESMHADRIES
jgi:hypothetical protein